MNTTLTRKGPAQGLLRMGGVALAAMAWATLAAGDEAEKAGPVWKTGAQGKWELADHWGARSVPEALGNVAINGAAQAQSHVILDGVSGDVVLSDLSVGGDWPNASLTVAGGALTVAGHFDVGALSRGTELSSVYSQTAGTVYANYFGVGGTTVGHGSDRNCVAEVNFAGGRFLCRALIVGAGAHSRCTVRVVGAGTASIVVLDRLALGTTELSTADGAALTSHPAMQFVLDANGVTPIVLWNPNQAVAGQWMSSVQRCELSVSLQALPPAEDIVLLRAYGPCASHFAGLPEGSTVVARDPGTGRTFVWALRYNDTRGGAFDIALTGIVELAGGKKRAYAGDGIHHARGAGVDEAAIETSVNSVSQSVNASLPPLRSRAGGPPAFPGAEGFGAAARGGRGGRVLFVTNLNDAGPGSLREACETQTGPRTVVFRVGGIISLTKRVTITSPFLTLAGQTAPGDGICLAGHGLEVRDTHDVILRYVRIRPGAKTGHIPCIGINICGSHDVIADHCSISWANWDGAYVSQGSDRYTLQHCIFAEGLASLQSYAAVIGSGRGSFHHNLLTHNQSRNPHFAKLCQCDWRNNVIYDWGDTCGYGDFHVISYVNNYLKPGPTTTQKHPQFIDDRSLALRRSLYLAGNVIEGRPEVQANNWLGVRWSPEAARDQDFTTTEACCAGYRKVTTQPAAAAYRLVLATAGATLPRRDEVDARNVTAVLTGTGKIIRSEEEVGGCPAYASAPAPADADDDGIPDAWEKAHGLNPNESSDANQAGADGYTQLENYLNELAAAAVR